MTVKGCWQERSGSYTAVKRSVGTLPPAVYTPSMDHDGYINFSPTNQYGDEIYDLPGLPIQLITNQISKFWEREEAYKKLGFVHKRGILLYGPPGNGKTCIIGSLIKNLVKAGGIAICVGEFSVASKALQLLKEIEPKRQVMTIMEDMDTLLSGDYRVEEPFALSMLDGQAQVNGVVHIATTNYPQQLADRFIRRPGRFDVVIGMGMPVKETRRAYFGHILGSKDHPEIQTLVEKTEGLPLSYLRDIAASYLCLDCPLDETLQRLKRNFKSQIKIEDDSSVGFKLGYDEQGEKHNDPHQLDV
jgi:ATPase family associated with various cellular activities (AAA)